ncbi:MAG: PKD domain-containing protein [bacterium]
MYVAGNELFYYTALVVDKNSVAGDRADELGLAYIPTVYSDGGQYVHVGTSQATMQTNIRNSGQRTLAEDVDLIVGMDHINAYNYVTRVRVTNGIPVNMTPDLPPAPSGPATGSPNEPVTIEVSTGDADNDTLYYNFNWGDGSKDDTWYGPYGAGDLCSVEHTYQANGDYPITVRATDVWQYQTGWSDPYTQSIGCCVVMGDIVPSGEINIEDLVYLVNYMFNQGPVPVCLDAADIDGNGEGPNIADLVYLVNYMFNQGPDPASCQ